MRKRGITCLLIQWVHTVSLSLLYIYRQHINSNFYLTKISQLETSFKERTIFVNAQTRKSRTIVLKREAIALESLHCDAHLINAYTLDDKTKEIRQTRGPTLIHVSLKQRKRNPKNEKKTINPAQDENLVNKKVNILPQNKKPLLHRIKNPCYKDNIKGLRIRCSEFLCIKDEQCLAFN